MIQRKTEIPTKLRGVLEALLEAAIYSADTESNEWDFAVSIQRLFDSGASETELRWLVRKGFVQHAREVTVEGDDGREFRPTGNLTFSDRTCFVLTELGIVIARLHTTSPINGHSMTSVGAAETQHTYTSQSALPTWDPDLRKLQFGGLIVKRFKWPAANQEAVLCAFEEEGWPERIDDPLVPQPEQDSKRRLADTIKCLNRKQVSELIHFRGDGTGEGVVWERVNLDADEDGV